MALKISAIPTPFLSFFILASFLTQRGSVQTLSSNQQNSSPSSPCTFPTGFTNTIIRAPLPSSPGLQVNPSFLSQHILFFYTDQNIFLSQSAFASFCLDQCVGYQHDPNATDILSDPLPSFYVTSRPGPCRSFTVDMGKPFPPSTSANSTEEEATRWYCEAFDQYFAEDGSNFVPVPAEAIAAGSYMYGLGVNRGCGGNYRAF